MNQNLLNTIHKFAEDREIDYMSAKVVGETFGRTFKNEADLVEWKQLIDVYLKSFESSAFSKIEMVLEAKKKEQNPEVADEEPMEDEDGEEKPKKKGKKSDDDDEDEDEDEEDEDDDDDDDDEDDDEEDEKEKKPKKKKKGKKTDSDEVEEGIINLRKKR